MANQLIDIDNDPGERHNQTAMATATGTATATTTALSALDELDNSLQALDLMTSSSAMTLSKLSGKLCNYSSKRRLQQSETTLANKMRILQH